MAKRLAGRYIAPMPLTLYDMRDSPHARKVRLLAAELGIPLEKVERDPRKGETRSRDYLALNPNGRVPVLEDDGFVVWESAAILKYLAAKHPERGLGGADPKQAALVDQWLFWWAAGPEAAIDMPPGSFSSSRTSCGSRATTRASSPTRTRGLPASFRCSTGNSTAAAT